MGVYTSSDKSLSLLALLLDFGAILSLLVIASRCLSSFPRIFEMLDPVSAFALACNVLQVVETGIKVLTKTVEFRKGTDNREVTTHKTLHDIFLELQQYNVDLEEESIASIRASAEVRASKARLLEINSECLRLSRDMVGLLDELGAGKGKISLFESFRKAVKAEWNKDKLEAMRVALSEAKSNIMVASLDLMHHLNEQSVAAILVSGNERERRIIDNFTSNFCSMRCELGQLTNAVGEMSLARTKDSDQEAWQFLLQKLDSIIAEQTAARLTKDQSLASEKEKAAQRRLIESLNYYELGAREGQVAKSHQKTFAWALDAEDHPDQSWDSLVSWARSDTEDCSRIYWVRGKPGSGKSTLMKLLGERLSGPDYFFPWSGDKSVIKTRSFFWNSGTPLQKSSEGLLRSILLQLLQQTPDLTSECSPSGNWRKAYDAGLGKVTWTATELKDSMFRFVHASDAKVFFLIDGLDEFEGTKSESEDLVEMLFELADSTNVKMCVSSRPWRIFEYAFEECPQLSLEVLTKNDIGYYVRDKLGRNRYLQQMQKLDNKYSNGENDLVQKLVSKAEGVFLWVALVVRELLRSLRDGDSLQTLSEKVDEIPPDLDDYFFRLLNTIQIDHRREAAMIFELMLHGGGCLLIFDLIFLGYTSPDHVPEALYYMPARTLSGSPELYHWMDLTHRRLDSRCMGLADCGPDWYITSTERRDQQLVSRNDIQRQIDFLHRSFRDFLKQDRPQKWLKGQIGHRFNALTYSAYTKLAQVELVYANDCFDSKVKPAVLGDLWSAFKQSEYHERQSELSVRITNRLLPLLMDVDDKDDPSLAPAEVGFGPFDHDIFNHDPGATALALALTYGMDSYILENLTGEAIAAKKGCSLLSYALGLWYPLNPPNPQRNPASVWAVKIILDHDRDLNQQSVIVSTRESTNCRCMLKWTTDNLRNWETYDMSIWERYFWETVYMFYIFNGFNFTNELQVRLEVMILLLGKGARTKLDASPPVIISRYGKKTWLDILLRSRAALLHALQQPGRKASDSGQNSCVATVADCLRAYRTVRRKSPELNTKFEECIAVAERRDAETLGLNT